jgi:methylase of polypeptide subunit release factors
LSDVFGSIDANGDLIIANPPYLVDRLQRAYRHGGGTLGIVAEKTFDAVILSVPAMDSHDKPATSCR